MTEETENPVPAAGEGRPDESAPDGARTPVPPGRTASATPITLPDGRAPKRVRSFVRRGRLSALTLERLETLGPERALPEGPFDPAAAFGRRAPLVLEIGCGHGHAAIAYAAAFPEHDILAMDVHTPGLARMLAEAEAAGVPNLRIEQGDAVVFLEERVADATFDAIHLFFPDPWRKKKHTKRRFVSPTNLDLLARVLRPGGHVLVATDQDFYAAHVLGEVAAHPRFTARRIERPSWRPGEGFEAKGIAAGRTINELRLDLVG
ncbi:tRNA (guanine-N7)-methyltransferase [Intrasporangium oryzae NRRL B-24470]|uniref:tRNA (guanine-N(7)-)-methyltransferase n=1 Tax=Intrasporangium oryzae NRRL B-24470 TaxID=1386089 RepID=W9G376_9MICO|nr:tRNA (guanosine(46)-N7)-methyltransferase TrmB [Intrasporangium oryzae]EWT00455.1 tRNA (guanine-N7)-methyltransferase [Intrasporangium oryzae NRRL B-24470]